MPLVYFGIGVTCWYIEVLFGIVVGSRAFRNRSFAS